MVKKPIKLSRNTKASGMGQPSKMGPLKDIDLDLAVVNARKDLNDFFDLIPRQENLSDTAVALRTMRLYEKLVKALDAKIASLGISNVEKTGPCIPLPEEMESLAKFLSDLTDSERSEH